MAIKEKVRLVFSDLAKHSYKYWDGELHDDGRVVSRFGVVGAANPQSKDFGCVGESFFRKKIREKEKKGYSHAKVLMDGAVTTTTLGANISLADIALSQIQLSDKSLQPLVKRLADSNVHKITNSTSISFDNGVFQTPLGIVTQEGIDEARNLLDFFHKNIKKNGKDEFNEKIDEYLKIIPRPKGSGLYYENIFPDIETVKKESDVLDALANSVELALKPKDTDGTVKSEKVFNLEMALVTDSKIIKQISDWYTKTNKAMHYYTNVKILNIYGIDIIDYNSKFLKDEKNITQVWHGSGQSNILSILKSGLLCSPPSTAAIAGKMFSNGVYGSETSSKSLGYTMGRWGQGKGDSGWLFICDFAMGDKILYTKNSFSRFPDGYTSCWALPKNTGLMNDELIVYDEKRIRVKYLLELK
jgi:poly [ADP-ribose] polymerase